MENNCVKRYNKYESDGKINFTSYQDHHEWVYADTRLIPIEKDSWIFNKTKIYYCKFCLEVKPFNDL